MNKTFGKTLTRLQPGMIVELSGVRHTIILVNDCRAVAVPQEKKVTEFTAKTGINADKVIKFAQFQPGVNISPNSEIPIVGRVEL